MATRRSRASSFPFARNVRAQVVRPTPAGAVLLDIDGRAVSAAERRTMCRRLRIAGFGVRQLQVYRSQHGGSHVVITVRPRPSPVMIVALQAILGSDPEREACNLLRVRRLRLGLMPALGRKSWNVLYEPSP